MNSPSAFLVSRSAVAGYLEKPLRESVDRLEEPLRTMARYHFGWDGCDNPTSPAGTRRRGATMTLLCSGSDPAIHWPRALEAAIAATLLLNSYVIYDDIIDNDRMRRGRPAVWTVYGLGATLQLGSALQALAFEILAETPAMSSDAVRRAAEITRIVCAGQIRDLQMETLHQVTLQQSLDMYREKDGGCAQLCCVLGALSAGGSTEQVEAASELGIKAGIVFALNGALAEIWGGPDRESKLAMSDLRQRKKTPLITAAMDLCGRKDREDLSTFLTADTHRTSEESLIHIVGILERSGVRAWAAQYIECHLDAIAGLLPVAVPDAQARNLISAYLGSLRITGLAGEAGGRTVAEA